VTAIPEFKLNGPRLPKPLYRAILDGLISLSPRTSPALLSWILNVLEGNLFSPAGRFGRGDFRLFSAMHLADERVELDFHSFWCSKWRPCRWMGCDKALDFGAGGGGVSVGLRRKEIHMRISGPRWGTADGHGTQGACTSLAGDQSLAHPTSPSRLVTAACSFSPSTLSPPATSSSVVGVHPPPLVFVAHAAWRERPKAVQLRVG